MAPHNFADTGADIRAIFLRLVQASREEEAMSRTTEFFQAVRERRHHRRCPEAHHRDVPSYGPAPVGRTERDDLDVWTNAFQPLGASGTQPDLRVDRMMQAFHINRREFGARLPQGAARRGDNLRAVSFEEAVFPGARGRNCGGKLGKLLPERRPVPDFRR